MLSINSIVYGYPHSQRPLLEGINLEVEPGHIYGLLGANGEGKSTLLYLIAGLLRPKAGTVTYKGIETFKRLPQTLADVFIVPEEFVLPSVSLAQYVKLNAQFYPNFSQDDLKRYLEHFRLDTDLHLGQLSMGQKKKVFVAFALACNTSLLLMDEPTNGLDIPGKTDFRRTIVSAMNDDRTIIISTHQVRDLDRILDHVVIMGNHKIILDRAINDITKDWTFDSVSNPAECQGVIYSEPVPGGYNVICENSGAEESDVNLETLFNYIFSQTQKGKQQ
jgi:ABC-2 type transport system ATP-binding protein